jgi:hypothetical protein
LTNFLEEQMGLVNTEETELLLGEINKKTKLLEPNAEPQPPPPPHKRRNWSYGVFLFAVSCVLVLGLVWVRGSKAATSSGWAVPSTPMHVVFFVVDDQGWNDVGYLSTDLFDLTPTIDALAADGVKLTNYYSLPTCTPARASLLTGLYTINTGMQHGVITSNYPFALPLDLAIVPQYFQERSGGGGGGSAFLRLMFFSFYYRQAAGYKTAMFGKWHLGHFRHAHLPRARGFDDFVGFYSGYLNHFTHVRTAFSCFWRSCVFSEDFI